MLAVVEHEEQLERTQPIEERGERSDVRPLGGSECVRDGARHQSGVRDRHQIGEPDPARPRADLSRGHLQCHPRLAGAAHSGQGDQAVLSQQLLELRELDLAADEARNRGREVVPGLHGGRRRDLVPQDRHLERA